MKESSVTPVATASVWIGCVANNSAAMKAGREEAGLCDGPLRRFFVMIKTKTDTPDWNSILIKCILHGVRPKI